MPRRHLGFAQVLLTPPNTQPPPGASTALQNRSGAASLSATRARGLREQDAPESFRRSKSIRYARPQAATQRWLIHHTSALQRDLPGQCHSCAGHTAAASIGSSWEIASNRPNACGAERDCAIVWCWSTQSPNVTERPRTIGRLVRYRPVNCTNAPTTAAIGRFVARDGRSAPCAALRCARPRVNNAHSVLFARHPQPLAHRQHHP